MNEELNNIHVWLCVDELSLKGEKSNLIIFHPPQKKITLDLKLIINGKELKRDVVLNI